MKDPLWAHDVGFGRPEPPALATCVPTEQRKQARRETEQRRGGGRSGTVAGDAAGLAPSRRITSCIYETSYLLITSKQATSPDLPVNGGSEVGTESWLGPVEPVFQTSGAHRREPAPPLPPIPPPPPGLSPAWPSGLSPRWLLIARLPPQGCALSSIFCRTDRRDVCARGLRGADAAGLWLGPPPTRSVLHGSVHRAPGCWVEGWKE